MRRLRRYIWLICTLSVMTLLATLPVFSQDGELGSQATDEADQGERLPALSLSVDLLEMRGVVAETTFEATFYLMTDQTQVRNVTLLANDLLTNEGARISANQYRLSDVTIDQIPADSGVMVQVTVPSVMQPGNYVGNIEVLFAGQTPEQRLILPIRLIAVGRPQLTLASGSSRLLLTSERGLGAGWSEPVTFALKNQGYGQAQIARFSVLPPPVSADEEMRTIPQSAVRLSPSLPTNLLPGIWQSYSLSVNRSVLTAGQYEGQLVLTTEDGQDTIMLLDLRLRDRPIFAWLWLLLGILVSLIVSYMKNGGTARLAVYRDLEGLEERLDDGMSLSPMLMSALRQEIRLIRSRIRWTDSTALSNEVTELEEDIASWQEVYAEMHQLRQRLLETEELPGDLRASMQQQLSRLERDTTDPNEVSVTVQQLQGQMDAAEESLVTMLQAINEWRSQLESWDQAANPLVEALLDSPAASSISRRLTTVQHTLSEGGYQQGVLQGRIQQLDREMQRLTELVDALLHMETHAEYDGQLRNALPNLPSYLASADSLFNSKSDFDKLLTQLESLGLLKKQVTSTIHMPGFPDIQTSSQAEIEPVMDRGGGMSTNDIEPLRQLRRWLDQPMNYLPWVQRLLQFVFLLLLAVAGMEALYFGRDTFGASGVSDYIALFLWGIGADASRKQLTDLESTANFIRQRVSAGNARAPS